MESQRAARPRLPLAAVPYAGEAGLQRDSTEGAVALWMGTPKHRVTRFEPVGCPS